MINDSSYKVSLIFALILHLVIILFLFVKFANSRHNVALVSSNNIIKAIAINERDFDNQMNKKIVIQASPPKQESILQNVVKKQDIPKEVVAVKSPKVVSQLQTTLMKNLLVEQARELAELKKEKQKYKKKVNKQKERQMQKLLQDQIVAEQKQLADSQLEAHGSRSSGEVDKYLSLIKQAVDSQWIKPDGVAPGDFCQLSISVAPGGMVLDVQIFRSSGNLALDRSAQAAVLKASPLPVPEDIKLFDDFRILRPTFNPEGMVGN